MDESEQNTYDALVCFCLISCVSRLGLFEEYFFSLMQHRVGEMGEH